MSEITFKTDNPISAIDFPVRVGDLWVTNFHYPIFNPSTVTYTVVRVYEDWIYGQRIILEDPEDCLVSIFDPRDVSVCTKTIRFNPELRIWTIDYLD